MAEMVRVNTRISAEMNEMLDQKSERTGYPKSTLIMLALEQYFNQDRAIQTMGDVMNEIRELKQKVGS